MRGTAAAWRAGPSAAGPSWGKRNSAGRSAAARVPTPSPRAQLSPNQTAFRICRNAVRARKSKGSRNSTIFLLNLSQKMLRSFESGSRNFAPKEDWADSRPDAFDVARVWLVLRAIVLLIEAISVPRLNRAFVKRSYCDIRKSGVT